MASQHLPNILKSTLDTLLKDSEVLSWIVKGGNEFTQVSIRFSNTAISTEHGELQYRRAPPSRIKRDHERAASRQQIYEEEDITNGAVDSETQTHQTPHLSSDVTVADDTLQDNSILPVIEAPTTSAQGQQGGTNNIETVTVASGHSLRGGIKSQPSNRNDTTATVSGHEDTDDSDSNDDTFSCDGCGCMMSGEPGTIWYRCTECTDTDLDFCTECYRKDIHSQHKSYLSKFTCPKDWSLPRCDSCGYIYKANIFLYIYQCTKCEDYSLCPLCKKQNRHNKHNIFLELILAQDYVAQL